MVLIAGNDNEKLKCDNTAHIDGYECVLPEEIRQKTDELKMKMKKYEKEYLKKLEKERVYTYGKYQGN